MRTLIVSTYLTLDGKPDDIREWALPYNDPEAAAYHAALLEKSDGLILGRKTYQIFATLWPALAGTVPYVDKINSMAKYVASTTLTDLQWENSHPIDGDVVEGIAALKEQPGGDLVLYGCHDLMHVLMAADLVDEYRLLISPVLLGKGRSFFDGGSQRVDLRLTDSTVMASGVAVQTYQPTRFSPRTPEGSNA